MPGDFDTYFLGVDVGTESVRCGLFDLNGCCLGITTVGYSTTFPRIGWAEQDPQQVWVSLKKAVQDCVSKYALDSSKIKAIGLTATAVTLVCVDKDNNPLGNAILWMDTRATKEAEIINKTQHPVLYYVGGKVSPEWMLPKLLWIKKNQPEIYNNSAYIVELMDWLNFNLTGRWTMSLSLASCEWNYSRPLGGWPRDLLSDLGIKNAPRKWPGELLHMGEPIGTISPSVSKLLGLDKSTIVVETGMDTYVASLGVNVLNTGKMAMVLGNSSCYLVLSKEEKKVPGTFGPIPDAFLPNEWAYQGGQTSAGSIIRWFSQKMGGMGNREMTYQELDQKALKIPPGAEELILLDTWQGERTPDTFPSARGALVGLSLKHTIFHIYRAFLESVAFGARHIVETFEKSGIEIKGLHACGGGTNSELWMQIFSDVLKKPIYLGSTPHCSALGGAICAASGSGYFNSLTEASNKMSSVNKSFFPGEDCCLYERPYHNYLWVKRNLKPYFGMLNE